MPNTSYSAALKEVYALAPSDVFPLNCLELSHTDLAEPLYIVQDRKEQEITLEDGTTVVTFQPVPFPFSPPDSNEDGIQTMNLSVDNVDQQVTDFLDQITTGDPLQVKLRIYLSDDLTTPQLDPPLVLYLTEVQIDLLTVSGRATFTDIVNVNAFREYYDRDRFPGLRG